LTHLGEALCSAGKVAYREMTATPTERNEMEKILWEAERLPSDVETVLGDIAEDASQEAFRVIAERLGDLGYPVTGDLMPDEAMRLEAAFRGFVRGMARNNPRIAAMNDEEAV
jgi:hypothetical protein